MSIHPMRKSLPSAVLAPFCLCQKNASKGRLREAKNARRSRLEILKGAFSTSTFLTTV
jgi:hypothetical protein